MATKLTPPEAQLSRTEPALPTDLARLKLEVSRKKVELSKARRAGGGPFFVPLAMIGLLLARLNAFLPMRAFQNYNRQHGPLMAAGIGFVMFFSITGLLATGFSIAGLVLRGQPELLDTIIGSVSQSAPGLLSIDGSDGLVDPKSLLNPTGLGWTAIIAAVVTILTALNWINGVREGLRGVNQLPPLTISPVVLKAGDAGALVLLGVALVVSSGASLVFGTAADLVTNFLSLNDAIAGPLTWLIKIAVPLLLGWATAMIMFRLAGKLKLEKRPLLEATILAAVGTTVLQLFSTELLANAGRNPLLAPFAIIIGLLIWFNLVSQVYLISGSWAAIRQGDLEAAQEGPSSSWGSRQVQPGKMPVGGASKGRGLAVRRRGTGLPRPR